MKKLGALDFLFSKNRRVTKQLRNDSVIANLLKILFK